MSKVTDENEHRRRSVEAGRQMLERYKARRLQEAQEKHGTDELSDEESLLMERSMERQGSYMHEGTSSRDITQSSVSMSEGEADGDLEDVAGRVAELEVVLQGKEAVVEALNAEIHHLRAEASSPNSSQSQSSSVQNRDFIASCLAKLSEYKSAVSQRDKVIEELASSFQQAVADRNVIVPQLSSLNCMQISNAYVNNGIELKQKIDTLETTLTEKNSIIHKLNEQLAEIQEHVQTLEMEREARNTEINYFTADASANTLRHQREIKASAEKYETEILNIQMKYEEHINLLKNENRQLIDRLNEELPDLENKHAQELSIFQAQLAHYKQTVETMKIELMNHTESQSTTQAEVNHYKTKFEELEIHAETTRRLQELNYQKEKEMLNEQINLHKIQIEDITTKCMTATALLESKESIEHSLDQALTDATTLRKENETLQFKLNDLSYKYSAAQSLIENNQVHERSLSTRIYDLEKSLSRLSGINGSMLSELNETTYQTFDEMAFQYQLTKKQLDEKGELEKMLADKIHNLEECIKKSNYELEQANLAKKSYEKELKDMKNMCDKLECEITSLKETNVMLQSTYIEAFPEQDNNKLNCNTRNEESIDIPQDLLKNFKAILEEKDKEIKSYTERIHEHIENESKLQADCQQLKNGLALAWSQCSEVEEKLNQTLALNDSNLDVSLSMLDCTTTLSKLFELIKNAAASADSITNQNIRDTNKVFDNIKNSVTASSNTETVAIETIDLHKDRLHSTKELKDYNEINEKLCHYYTLYQQLLTEKENMIQENAILKLKQEEFPLLLKSVEQLKEEKISLTKVIEKMELSLLSSAKEHNEKLNALKNELQAHHTIEMEELRTYFEQKCLQMGKEYEEEIFSQQSKKMSDNDSKMEDLSDDIYFGGAGDCLNVSNIPERMSREGPSLSKDVLKHRQDQVDINSKALLSCQEDDGYKWPPELLELREKLTSNAKQEVQSLKETHAALVHQLKDEYSRNVSRMIERHKDEINKIKKEIELNCDRKNYMGQKHPVDNKNIIESDTLYRTCTTLKELVGELIKYFIICEEEVNNTLITEVLKRQLINVSDNEKDMIEGATNSTLESSDERSVKVKRVHFAPQSTEIVSILNSDNDTLHYIIGREQYTTDKLKKDLSMCLHRLKSESAEILGHSTFSDEKPASFSNDIMWTHGINKQLKIKLNHAEAVIIEYEEELERLKLKVLEMQQKLALAENKKEIISEGYGEHHDTGTEITYQDFSQLQEKARNVISNGGGDCSYLLQLIEELCRQSDKLMDDSKKEKEDLQQQIHAADKQLRGMRRFLDEQASEREIERDDSLKQIQQLREHLKEREREKERDLRISSEVETLETQMREMAARMSDAEAKELETETELTAAIEKISFLREIIADLEQQIQSVTEREQSLHLQNSQLKAMIVTQTQELNTIKMGGEDGILTEHINQLQGELEKHKLSSEHFHTHSSTMKQIRMELRDMHNFLDKRIKDLESVHMCGSNLSLSQPSEDVSIREQIDAARCPTPDDPSAPPTLPLDQILQLKEKVLKQARTEEVVFKRIKDLEMQLTAIKNQNEELQAEQDILQQTNSEQLFQIQAMRGRLEQHKQSAPFAQKQAVSRLELQLHEANDKLQLLERTIADKELELKETSNQLDRVNQLLIDKEAEIANVVQVESATIQQLKERLEVVEEEKNILQSKVGIQELTQLELPQLIDSMLADKNEEIDHLKKQLTKKEKQLDIYTSLVLDDGHLRELTKETEVKNSARTLSDILSIHSECEDVAEAIRDTSTSTHMLPQNMSTLKVPPVLSSVAKDTFNDTFKQAVHIPPLDLGSHSQSISGICVQPSNTSIGADLMNSELPSKSSSPENNVLNLAISTDSSTISKERDMGYDPRVYNSFAQDVTDNADLSTSDKKRKFVESCEKHKIAVAIQTEEFIDEIIKSEIQNLERQLQIIMDELNLRSIALEERDAALVTLQKQYEELQIELKETTDTLIRDKCFYKNQYELSQVSENKIKNDLQEVENVLKLKGEELEDYKMKMQVNEKMITELNSENVRLKQSVEEQDEKHAKQYTSLVQETAQELQALKDTLMNKEIIIETIQTRNIEIENENKQLYEYKTKYKSKNKCDQFKQELFKCQNEIQRLTDGLNNRDQVIRRLEEMARRTSLSGTSSPLGNKDQEIHHLQEYLKEKDKVIQQMSDDSKSLHRALETIQNKMKESGNIVELRKKLKEEHKINAELKDIVDALKKELDQLKEPPLHRLQGDTEIEDMVQRELNLSEHLDKRILSAIESESNETASKEIECYSSVNGKVACHICDENILQKYLDIKQKLNETDKFNGELKKLKDELEIEKDTLKSQVIEYENRIFQLKSDLVTESKKVLQLDNELSSERCIVRSLKIQLEKEQRSMESGHIQDSELIQFLQAKLKSSKESENELHDKLLMMRDKCNELEIQLSSVTEKVQLQKSDELPELTKFLEAEQQKYVVLMDKFEKERRDNIELQDILKKLQTEKDRYQKQLEIINEEKEELISSLALIEGLKENLGIDLKRTKEELKGRDEECEWLQRRIKSMSDADTKREEQRAADQKIIQELRWEGNNAREVMMDLEADMKQAKAELLESREQELKLSAALERLQERKYDLTKKLSSSRDEQKKLNANIMDLKQNLTLSLKRESDLSRELEDMLSKEKNVPTKLLQKVKDLTESNKKYATDKQELQEKLNKALRVKEDLANCMKTFEAQVYSKESENKKKIEKLTYFYGKYLRAVSRLKSLTYQKRYLLCIVTCYQQCEENTLYVLSQLTKKQRAYIRPAHNRKRPKIRFRCAALAIISLVRMKWLVIRWRIGKRVGAKTLVENNDELFVPLPSSAVNYSPPIRERSPASEEGALSSSVFKQYCERIRNIQQTLGLAMAEPTINHVTSG